jgi:hypothetical protein
VQLARFLDEICKLGDKPSKNVYVYRTGFLMELLTRVGAGEKSMELGSGVSSDRSGQCYGSREDLG